MFNNLSIAQFYNKQKQSFYTNVMLLSNYSWKSWSLYTISLNTCGLSTMISTLSMFISQQQAPRIISQPPLHAPYRV